MDLWELPAMLAHGYAIAFCTRRLARTAVQFAVASVIVALFAGVCLPVTAAGETRNVLVLYSNGRLLPANIEVDHGLREAIRASADRPINLFDEFLDAPCSADRPTPTPLPRTCAKSTRLDRPR